MKRHDGLRRIARKLQNHGLIAITLHETTAYAEGDGNQPTVIMSFPAVPLPSILLCC
jgi:hypothetical protein